jgi:hypothetical protein
LVKTSAAGKKIQPQTKAKHQQNENVTYLKQKKKRNPQF